MSTNIPAPAARTARPERVVDLSTIPTQPWALLDEFQASAVAGRKVKGLRSDRLQGRGAKYIKLNSTQVRYRLGDLQAWIEQQPVFTGAATNTTDTTVRAKRTAGRPRKGA